MVMGTVGFWIGVCCLRNNCPQHFGGWFQETRLERQPGVVCPQLEQGAGPNSDDSDIPGTRVGSVNSKSPITFVSELCYDLANEQFDATLECLEPWA
jgi:hypothetical protein